MMRSLYLLIFSLMLVFAVQEVTAQANPNVVSIGANLNFHNNTTNNSPTFNSRLHLDPNVHYFYRQNRAIVGGFIFHSSRNQYLSYEYVDNSESVWLNRRSRRGAYLGLRQLHPINEKLYIFTEFGIMYSRDRYRNEHIRGPQYRDGYSRESHSISGYGNLGLLYFINKRFSIETTFVNAKIDFSRPMNVDYASKTWSFQIEGANHLALGLRYYF